MNTLRKALAAGALLLMAAGTASAHGRGRVYAEVRPYYPVAQVQPHYVQVQPYYQERYVYVAPSYHDRRDWRREQWRRHHWRHDGCRHRHWRR